MTLWESFVTSEWSLRAVGAVAAVDRITPAAVSGDAARRALRDQRRHWDRWHRRHAHACHPGHAQASRKYFLTALDMTDGDVLELGCGQGRDAIALADASMHVVGVDHSPVAIGVAEDLVAQRTETSGSVTLHLADYFEFLRTCASATFDGIFSHLALHYFDESSTRALFTELARVVRPQGVLLFTVRAAGDPLDGHGAAIAPSVYVRNGHLRHFFAEDLVHDLLADWPETFVRKYDRSGEETNPGKFILGVARR